MLDYIHDLVSVYMVNPITKNRMIKKYNSTLKENTTSNNSHHQEDQQDYDDDEEYH